MEDYGNVGLSWQKDASWGSYHVTTLHAYEPVILENVGNRIIEPINNPEIRWHVPRLTRTEWEELYGDN